MRPKLMWLGRWKDWGFVWSVRETYFNGTGKSGRKPNSVNDAKLPPYKEFNVTPHLYLVGDYPIRFFSRLQTNLECEDSLSIV